MDTLHQVYPYVVPLVPGSQLNQLIYDNIALATIQLKNPFQSITYATTLLPGQTVIPKFIARNFILNDGEQSEKFSENKVPVDIS